MLTRIAINLLRTRPLPTLGSTAPLAAGHRYVHKDFRGPEWDLKEHQVVDTYAADEIWKMQLRRPDNEDKRFEYYDQVVWRPGYRHEDGAAKMAECFHVGRYIKHSPMKLFYACHLAQGRSVDDADRQLKHIPRKSAIVVRDVLKDAVEKALQEHRIEFRSNLWVAECFAKKCLVVDGVRRHARERWGEVSYIFSDVFVRLEEGQPPAFRTRDGREPVIGGHEQGEEYLEYLRKRSIKHGL